MSLPSSNLFLRMSAVEPIPRAPNTPSSIFVATSFGVSLTGLLTTVGSVITVSVGAAGGCSVISAGSCVGVAVGGCAHVSLLTALYRLVLEQLFFEGQKSQAV
jgi:hypothetical protein